MAYIKTKTQDRIPVRIIDENLLEEGWVLGCPLKGQV